MLVNVIKQCKSHPFDSALLPERQPYRGAGSLLLKRTYFIQSAMLGPSLFDVGCQSVLRRSVSNAVRQVSTAVGRAARQVLPSVNNVHNCR